MTEGYIHIVHRLLRGGVIITGNQPSATTLGYHKVMLATIFSILRSRQSEGSNRLGIANLSRRGIDRIVGVCAIGHSCIGASTEETTTTLNRAQPIREHTGRKSIRTAGITSDKLKSVSRLPKDVLSIGEEHSTSALIVRRASRALGQGDTHLTLHSYGVTLLCLQDNIIHTMTRRKCHKNPTKRKYFNCELHISLTHN